MIEGLGWGHLAAFNAALLLATAAPGPAFLVCVQASLRGGPREGAATGAGLAFVAGLWTLAALLGLDAVFDAVPAAYATLKVAGAALVLAIAVQTWRAARVPIEAEPPASERRAFLRGALLNLGNPKSILFSAGVLLVIFPPDLTGAEMALITINHIALELVIYGALAHFLARPAIRARYLAAKPSLMRAMALVLGGLGIRLLVAP